MNLFPLSLGVFLCCSMGQDEERKMKFLFLKNDAVNLLICLVQLGSVLCSKPNSKSQIHPTAPQEAGHSIISVSTTGWVN